MFQMFLLQFECLVSFVRNFFVISLNGWHHPFEFLSAFQMVGIIRSEFFVSRSSSCTLQAESPSIFLDKSGRGRRLCEQLRDSLICRSSEKIDESVQFPVGQTGFSLTPMIILKNC